MFAPRVAPPQREAGAKRGNAPPPACCAEPHHEADRSPAGREAAGMAGRDLSRVPIFPAAAARPPRVPLALPASLQRKIVVGEAGDPLEHEADRVADEVMRTEGPVAPVAPARRRLSRQCAACEDEERIRLLHRKPGPGETAPGEAPGLVHEVLRSSGEPLEGSARAFFETRFQSDFSQVRVHADARAAQSAAAVNARAYTVGSDIAFARGQYQPLSPPGRRLIAHELAHVVQQSGPRAGAGRGDRATLRRADPNAVMQVMKMHSVVGAGIQFFPRDVIDTRIGPVSVQGGLLSHGASRLNVVIGAGLTPRVLARELLPLWTTATPFTPAGGGPANPPGALSEEQLAQGLLVYNQYYLPVPAMTQWRAGLRFPLPVEIEEATGVATLNADVIRSMAASFDPAWTRVLAQAAAATTAPPAAAVQAEVAAFLAAEPSALGRGIGLAARALTNAQAALPFVRQAFAQLGAAGFEVALTMADELVVGDMALLAGQRDGDEILTAMLGALNPTPAAVPPAQQASLNRLTQMFNRVAGTPLEDPAAPVARRAEKAVTVDLVKLDGSTHNPATDLAVANMIFAQCNVRTDLGVEAPPVGPQQTTDWIGANRIVPVGSCPTPSARESRMFRESRTLFGLAGRIRAYFLPAASTGDRGYSRPPFCASGIGRDTAVVTNSGDTSTLAHEIGHILLSSPAHPRDTLMGPVPHPNELTDRQCAAIYRHA